MKRRTFLHLLTAAGVGALNPIRLSAAGKIPRIGYLVYSTLSDPPTAERAAFLAGLRELGYEDGKNIAIEYRAADWDREKVPFLADELVELNVDVIVAVAETSVRAARAASSTIPIVMPFSGDPAGTGLVASLAHPGGNLTGLSIDVTPEIGGKMVQMLKEMAPRIHTVTVCWNSHFAAYPKQVGEMHKTARALGMRLMEIREHSPQEVEAALATIDRHPPDALIVLADPPTSAARELIAELARRHRMPTMFDQRLYVDAGGLISYGPNLADNFRRAAWYVDKILKGTRPGDLPIEQPSRIELIVNSRTAKAIGLAMPQSILVRADEVLR